MLKLPPPCPLYCLLNRKCSSCWRDFAISGRWMQYSPRSFVRHLHQNRKHWLTEIPAQRIQYQIPRSRRTSWQISVFRQTCRCWWWVAVALFGRMRSIIMPTGSRSYYFGRGTLRTIFARRISKNEEKGRNGGASPSVWHPDRENIYTPAKMKAKNGAKIRLLVQFMVQSKTCVASALEPRT